MKCVSCGHENLVEGKIVTEYGTDQVRFRPAGGSQLKAILGIGARPVRAYGCARCSNLQFSVEFTDDDLQKFLEFEGEQPGILERLNKD